MKTLVLANQKGGVGKSAVATLLAHVLRCAGKSVLAIDLDHQGNFSKALRLSGHFKATAATSDAFLTSAAVQAPAGSAEVVLADKELLLVERERERHNQFLRNLRANLRALDARFDVCLIDTNPNPDIRVIAALASADFVLSPIQLNQEAIDGVHSLLNHPRVGLRKIKAVLNPQLQLVGLLPTMVDPSPFQRENLKQVAMSYASLLVRLGATDSAGFAQIPKRTIIAECQASGEVLWEAKKTAARDTWREIAPSLKRIAEVVCSASAIGSAAGASSVVGATSTIG